MYRRLLAVSDEERSNGAWRVCCRSICPCHRDLSCRSHCLGCTFAVTARQGIKSKPKCVMAGRDRQRRPGNPRPDSDIASRAWAPPCARSLAVLVLVLVLGRGDDVMATGVLGTSVRLVLRLSSQLSECVVACRDDSLGDRSAVESFDARDGRISACHNDRCGIRQYSRRCSS